MSDASTSGLTVVGLGPELQAPHRSFASLPSPALHAFSSTSFQSVWNNGGDLFDYSQKSLREAPTLSR